MKKTHKTNKKGEEKLKKTCLSQKEAILLYQSLTEIKFELERIIKLFEQEKYL